MVVIKLELTRLKMNSIDVVSLANHAHNFITNNSCEILIVSLGEQGAVLFTENHHK